MSIYQCVYIDMVQVVPPSQLPHTNAQYNDQKIRKYFTHNNLFCYTRSQQHIRTQLYNKPSMERDVQARTEGGLISSMENANWQFWADLVPCRRDSVLYLYHGKSNHLCGRTLDWMDEQINLFWPAHNHLRQLPMPSQPAGETADMQCVFSSLPNRLPVQLATRVWRP